jgi:hypothetical protein
MKAAPPWRSAASVRSAMSCARDYSAGRSGRRCSRVADRGHAHLLQRVAVAHRHRAVLRGLPFDRDAERRPTSSWRRYRRPIAPIIVEDGERPAQIVRHACRISGMPSFFTSGKTPALIGASAGASRAPSALTLAGTSSSRYAFTSTAAPCDRRRPRSRSRTARIAVVRLVEVLELLVRVLLVTREVEVAAVVHALDLLEAERAAEVELTSNAARA